MFEFQRTQSWVETNAFVQDIKLEKSSSRLRRGGLYYKYRIIGTYSYSYNDKSYQSSRISLTGQKSTNIQYHRELFRTLRRAKPRANPITAYVNPRNPAQSILDRRIEKNFLIQSTLLGGFLTLFGLILIKNYQDQEEPFN